MGVWVPRIFGWFGKYEGDSVREEERGASRHSGFNLALKRRTSGRGRAMSERGAGCHWLGRIVVAMDAVYCALSIRRKATRLGSGDVLRALGRPPAALPRLTVQLSVERQTGGPSVRLTEEAEQRKGSCRHDRRTGGCTEHAASGGVRRWKRGLSAILEDHDTQLT